MYCRNCYRKISDNSKFCRYCGAPVTEAQAAAAVKKGTEKNKRLSMPSITLIIALIIIALTVAIIMVTKSTVFQKAESISYKDYIGVWQERGTDDIEENGGVRLEIHGRDADTLIISMYFYGVAEQDIAVDQLGAVIKDGKAYYSFTNDGYGNSGNGVLTFSGRDIEWKSTVNKNDSVIYTVSKVPSKNEEEMEQHEVETPLVQPETNEEEATDEYILADSDKAYVTEEQLKTLTQEELRIARNEIMARHGRIFRDPTLDAYFRSKDWYEPVMAPDEFDSQSGKILNKYEIKNIALIKQMEE